MKSQQQQYFLLPTATKDFAYPSQQTVLLVNTKTIWHIHAKLYVLLVCMPTISPTGAWIGAITTILLIIRPISVSCCVLLGIMLIGGRSMGINAWGIAIRPEGILLEMMELGCVLPFVHLELVMRIKLLRVVSLTALLPCIFMTRYRVSYFVLVIVPLLTSLTTTLTQEYVFKCAPRNLPCLAMWSMGIEYALRFVRWATSVTRQQDHCVTAFKTAQQTPLLKTTHWEDVWPDAIWQHTVDLQTGPASTSRPVLMPTQEIQLQTCA